MLIFPMLSISFVGCSPKVDYRGVINYQFLGGSDSTEVEISCKDKMARVIGSGDPNKRLDRIEEVSQNWRKINEIAQNASKQLETSKKSGLIGGTLEMGAFGLQGAIQDQYDKACNRSQS